ncbi:MAG: hypothetical protein Q8S57_05695 [Methanoregula sp.]|nr:hypothetical protein [Methanoregula sp.]
MGKKEKSLRHKLRAVVDDTALALRSVPAKSTFDPHAVLQIRDGRQTIRVVLYGHLPN